MAALEREHSTDSITSGDFDPRKTGPRKDTNPTEAHNEASNRTKESVAQGQGCIRYPRISTPKYKLCSLAIIEANLVKKKCFYPTYIILPLRYFICTYYFNFINVYLYPHVYPQISEPVYNRMIARPWIPDLHSGAQDLSHINSMKPRENY